MAHNAFASNTYRRWHDLLQGTSLSGFIATGYRQLQGQDIEPILAHSSLEIGDRDRSLFDEYNQEYLGLVQQIQKSNHQATHCKNNEEQNGELLQQSQSALVQAKQLIVQMQLQARSLDKASQAMVNDYRSSLRRLEDGCDRAQQTHRRNGLLGDASGAVGNDVQLVGGAQRERMQLATTKARSQNKLLQGALQSVADAETVADSITEELGGNREKIEKARRRVKQVESLIASARRTVSNIANRDKRTKLAIYGCLCFVFVAMMIATIAMLFASGSSTNKAPIVRAVPLSRDTPPRPISPRRYLR